MRDLEYWRDQLAQAVKRRGSLQHPEVLRISTILDQYVVAAQKGAPKDSPGPGPESEPTDDAPTAQRAMPL